MTTHSNMFLNGETGSRPQLLKSLMLGGIVIIAAASCTSQSLKTTFNNQNTKIDTYATSVQFLERELGINSTVDSDGDIISQNYVLETVDTIIPRVTHNKGAVRLTIVEGSGEDLGANGSATFYFAGYVFSNGPSSVQMLYIGLDGTEESWVFSTPYTTFNVTGSPTTGASISVSGSSSGLTFFATNHYATASFSGQTLSESELEPVTYSLKDNNLIEGLRYGLEGVKAGEVCDVVFSGELGLGNRVIGTVPANSALLYRIWVESISN